MSHDLQVKQDLRMLALRGVFDPKRFYRAPDATKFPKYFQMGTVVAGPTDFYSGECASHHSGSAPERLCERLSVLLLLQI